MSVFEIDRVTRRYGAKTALRDVSLALPQGEVLGLVGLVSGTVIFSVLRSLVPFLPLSPLELTLGLFLLVPLVRVQLAALTLHANRHR